MNCNFRLGARVTLQKRCEAEEMIAVSVGDIDRGEVLAARVDPIQQGLRLLGREKGVHENGVALTLVIGVVNTLAAAGHLRMRHKLGLCGW
jgi:hypothetical protein